MFLSLLHGSGPAVKNKDGGIFSRFAKHGSDVADKMNLVISTILLCDC
jgi:hypothetical protein